MAFDLAAFEIKAKKYGIQSHIIVKLYDGVSYYYFSDVNMRLGFPTTPFVYGLIKSFSGIKEGFDWATKSWDVANVDIELVNAPYRMNSSGVMVRPSDDIGGVTGYTATVYLALGETITTFPDDCLARFVGKVSPGLEYDQATVKFSIIDNSKFLNITLPKNTMASVFADAPLDVLNKKIPLVYGDFTFAGAVNDTYAQTGNGMAIGLPTNKKVPPEFVYASHVIDSFNTDANRQIFIKVDELKEPVMYDSSTEDTDDSGYATVTGSEYAHAVLYPDCPSNEKLEAVGPYSPTKDATGWALPSDYENACDRNLTTYMTVKDTQDDNTDIFCDVHFKLPDGSFLSTVTELYCDDVIIQGKIEKYASATGSVVGYVMNAADGTCYASPGFGSYFDADGSYESMGSIEAAFFALYGYPSMIKIWCNDAASGNADGTPENFNMLKVYEIRCRVKYKPPLHKVSYAPLKGRWHGAWVTADSRSNGYAATDEIVDPAMIIESLLRDELSITTIDTASFDAALNSSVPARINIHSENEALVFDIIKQLAEQSTFAFFWSAANKAYLIDMQNESPSIAETIPASMICADEAGLPEIKITKTTFLANKATIKSRYQQEYNNIYRDLTTIENTTATAGKFGTMAIDLQWPNICGTSATHVANHYIRKADGSAADGNGIWANEHNQVEFATVGYSYAHLQPGDWVKLDSTTVDPHIKAFGESWATIDLLITNVDVQAGKTVFTAIELF